MKESKLALYRRWILVNVLGGGVGLALTKMEIFGGRIDDVPLRLLRTFMVFSLGGLAIGGCQALGLLRVLRGGGIAWALSTGAGLGVSAVVAWDFVSRPYGIVVFGVAAGLALGSIQMLLSRSWLTNPAAWFFWTLLAWGFGYPLLNQSITTFYVHHFIPDAMYMREVQLPLENTLMIGLAVGLVVGLVGGLPLLGDDATRREADEYRKDHEQPSGPPATTV